VSVSLCLLLTSDGHPTGHLHNKACSSLTTVFLLSQPLTPINNPPPPPHPHATPTQFDCELDASHLRDLVAAYKGVYKRNKLELPQDPWEQLRMGIDAVFRSWNIPRAVKYREINKITGLKGTAVNVQVGGVGGWGRCCEGGRGRWCWGWTGVRW